MSATIHDRLFDNSNNAGADTACKMVWKVNRLHLARFVFFQCAEDCGTTQSEYSICDLVRELHAGVIRDEDHEREVQESLIPEHLWLVLCDLSMYNGVKRLEYVLVDTRICYPWARMWPCTCKNHGHRHHSKLDQSCREQENMPWQWICVWRAWRICAGWLVILRVGRWFFQLSACHFPSVDTHLWKVRYDYDDVYK